MTRQRQQEAQNLIIAPTHTSTPPIPVPPWGFGCSVRVARLSLLRMQCCSATCCSVRVARLSFRLMPSFLPLFLSVFFGLLSTPPRLTTVQWVSLSV